MDVSKIQFVSYHRNFLGIVSLFKYQFKNRKTKLTKPIALNESMQNEMKINVYYEK